MNEVKRISATQLGMFTDCPRKWWAHYVKKIERPEPSEAIKIGLAVHQICEVSLNATKKGIEKYSDPMVLLEPAVKEYELQKRDRAALSMMLENVKLMGWYEDPQNSHPEFEKLYKIDDVEVIVKIDRLLKTPEYVHVVDLKSGKYPYDENTLKENWQARLYTIPFLQEYDKVKMDFWFLRFFHKSISCMVDQSDLPVFLDEIREVINKMRRCEGHEYHESKLCQWCPFFNECQEMNRNK
jgi:hypothetical protein